MHSTLELVTQCKATDGTMVELWHWPDCRMCGASRYGGPVPTGWCHTCEVNHMADAPRLHAELSASSAERWMNCPGSVRLIRLLPWEMPPSVYAVEGTAMHLAAARWLQSGVEPDWQTTAFAGVVLEDDMIDAVREYVAMVLADKALFGGELVVERRFSLASLRKGMFGTNDAMLLGCRDRVLRVYDFKGGVGVVVEVVGNAQLLYYGYGAVLTAKAGPIEALELVICQPRARHRDGTTRRWRVDLIDAYDWSHDLLEAAERTDDPSAPLHAGEWCRFCPAAGTCTEYRDHALRQAQLEFSDPPPPLPDPAMMSNSDLGRLLPKLEIVEGWMKIIRHRAHAEAEAGRDIPDHKLVQKRGRRQWARDERDVVSVMHELGMNDGKIFNTELKSPAQMEKALPKEQRSVIAELAHMVSSGTKLVHESTPGTPVPGTGLAVFTPLPEGQPLD